MPRLTRRGVALLVAVVVVFAAGQLLGFAVLLALAGVGVGALVAALLVGTHRPKVEVTREVYPDRVSRGGAAIARRGCRTRAPAGRPVSPPGTGSASGSARSSCGR
ncbi:hypothetical protein [Fodinicola feengrottensis]|uniref:hypothetical protein n=1 Tax=Fodinicola feengrottensis TaxID=435914 RepID=UPI0013D19356|nr:hypothetical protein [Fodinicola feengrottensis]